MRDGERGLLEYVEAEARELSGEAFTRFMAEVYARLQLLISKGWVGARAMLVAGGLGVAQEWQAAWVDSWGGGGGVSVCQHWGVGGEVHIAMAATAPPPPPFCFEPAVMTLRSAWGRCWPLTS